MKKLWEIVNKEGAIPIARFEATESKAIQYINDHHPLLLLYEVQERYRKVYPYSNSTWQSKSEREHSILVEY